ncbi:hypothetical protein BJ742DRAFT_804317 [Cladochytrium replicatum]|nr:hypothetical protein BJ742DRAFT_804317 [Cladochytrium replicatum]
MRNWTLLATAHRNFFAPRLATGIQHLSIACVVSPSFKIVKMLRREIFLSDTEEKICSLLVDVTKNFAREAPDRPPIIVRISGGWVRDKLLGKESNDLDFALDTITGYEFAAAVNQYLTALGVNPGHLSKIESNPDKSKHLETATTKILGHSADFVNLRTEVYLDHSRVPEVAFGTPKEDAERRDITINALFYNIHTKEVEDFTGMGLEDLSRGYIRTPLPPLQTFIDDPLRVLRVIRFASKFGYALDPAIGEAVKDYNIKTSFDTKISRERVGVEIDKMMKGPDPVRALSLLVEFGFYPLVFEPFNPEENMVDPTISLQTARTLLSLDMNGVLEDLTQAQWKGSDHFESWMRVLYLAAACLPFRKMTYTEKTKEYPMARFVVAVSLKLSTHDNDHVVALLSYIPRVRELVAAVEAGGAWVSRQELGTFVRDMGAKPLFSEWNLSVIFALMVDLAELEPLAVNLDDPRVISIISKYRNLLHRIQQDGLQQAWDLKPILSGKEVGSLLGMKPGKMIGTVLHEVILWQFRNPHGSREECETWLKGQFPNEGK